ncbi:hypothetical protein D9M68_963330 [compost metagenome]
MSPRQLSHKLADFGIKSKDIRIGSINKKGFDCADFTDAFGRYLSGDTPSPSATPRHAYSHAGSSHSQSATQGAPVADEISLQPSDHAGCRGVADKIPPQGEEGPQVEIPVFDESDKEEF